MKSTKHSLPLVLCLLLISGTGTLRAIEKASQLDGKPSFSQGYDVGYFVWKDGETWKVRWTTKGQQRHFTGNVIADSGKLKSLKRIDVEKASKVVRRGRPARLVRGPRGRARVRRGRGPVVVTKTQDKIEKDGDRKIWFDSKTDADIDGFDFKPDKNVETLRFALKMGGESRIGLIHLGKDRKRPTRTPFTVLLK